MTQALSDQKKIERVLAAYAEFERSMQALEKEKNDLIQKIKSQLDQAKVKEMLNNLKSL